MDYVPRNPVGAKRPRPKLCAVCHVGASYVEVEIHRLVLIDQDAVVRYQQVPHGTYYCANHTGMLQ